MRLNGEWPAIVRAYDGDSRICQVEVLGLTDGASAWPEAQMRYPLGDKSYHTEIHILPGDTVWVAFECGDPRYPIITGYRNPTAGNEVGVRRWHHENIALQAFKTLVLDAGTTCQITAGESITLTVGGTSFRLDAGGFTQVGKVKQTGGDITSDGVGLQAHHHTEQGDGAPTSKAQA